MLVLDRLFFLVCEGTLNEKDAYAYKDNIALYHFDLLGSLYLHLIICWCHPSGV